jgi:mono/diheme cytochrome c family protein
MTRRLLLLFAVWTAVYGDQPAPPWEKASAAPLTGQSLFREYCTVCHDIDKDQANTRKLGPSLRHLFKNARLPLSKGRPTRAYVVTRIQFGGPLMPSFMNRITDKQMSALLAYLETK